MRAALFSPVDAQDEAMGSLVETAIFSQWFHRDILLYYARWSRGEVDIVHLDSKQKLRWAVEVKWSDYFFHHPEKLGSLLKFCHTKNLDRATVTTTREQGLQRIQNVTLRFIPASLYCYMLGYNILHGKNTPEND